MTAILTVLMALVIGYLFNVNRRLKQLELMIQESGPPAFDSSDWLAAPPAEVPEEAEESLPAAEPTLMKPPAPEPAILYAEQRPEAVEEPIQQETWTEPEPQKPAMPSISFEELFGRRLPIWAGGITLAVAGVLIVKLSIEAGLLSPPVRVILGSIFGFALIGAAELALRQEHRVRDERVRQALSGAGLASLYATILVATNLYHLIPPLAAMAGMALVTALAMLLSVRFGAPSALLGLVGGLAAPAVVGSPEPNVPLLSVYLALAVGGLTALSRNQRWAWLGVSTLLGGFGWGIALLVSGALDLPGTISLGLYILLLGIALPALGLAGERRDQLQLIAGVVAAAQMAALVATGGFDLVNWGLFGLIAIALGWLAAREPKLALLPPVALTVGLLLLGGWPDPAPRDFIVVAAGLAMLQGVMPFRRLWSDRGGILDAGQLSAILVGVWVIAMMQFYRLDGSTDQDFGLLALSLTVVSGAVGGLGWRVASRHGDARFVMLATSSAFLLASAASLLLPSWPIGAAIAALGLGLLHLGQVGEDQRFEPIAWVFAGAGLATSVADYGYGDPHWMDAARWGLTALVAGLFAWRARFSIGRGIAQFVTPVLLYAASAPLIIARFEPLVPALILLAAAGATRMLRGERLIPAMAAAMLMSLAWALMPIGEWAAAGAASLMGDPVLVSGVPDVEVSLTKLVVPALLAVAAMWIGWRRLEGPWQPIGYGFAAVLGVVGGHSLFKQIFAIGSEQQFLALGLAERTVWELILAAAGVVALRLWRRLPGYALAGAAAAHLVAYSLVIHNPLWAAQQVGPWPVLNLLLPLYALAFALLLVIERSPIGEDEVIARVISAAPMLLIGLFGFSTLRQLFHGSLLVGGSLGQAEDIGRSLVAIALAIGFLLWGIRSRRRDWRIASLVLMLAAVGKVFLLDAAGLEGMVRIGSFVALGFSLIGIGWLYSRHLSGDEPKLVPSN